MTRYSYDPRAYEERYRKVYGAGAEFWEQLLPTDLLVRYLAIIKTCRSLRAIEFGCGEGRDSIFLARRGLRVLGVDSSRAAVERGKRRSTQEGLNVEFVVADVSDVPVKDEVFDLAVNVACLHMMTDQKARDRHLHESNRILKKGGKYFSCNLGVDESTSLENFYDKRAEKPGTLIKRKITVHGREQEIRLPVIAAWPKSKAQYVEEFCRAGLTLGEAKKVKAEPVGTCWMVVAEKNR